MQSSICKTAKTRSGFVSFCVLGFVLFWWFLTCLDKIFVCLTWTWFNYVLFALFVPCVQWVLFHNSPRYLTRHSVLSRKPRKQDIQTILDYSSIKVCEITFFYLTRLLSANFLLICCLFTFNPIFLCYNHISTCLFQFLSVWFCFYWFLSFPLHWIFISGLSVLCQVSMLSLNSRHVPVFTK